MKQYNHIQGNNPYKYRGMLVLYLYCKNQIGKDISQRHKFSPIIPHNPINISLNLLSEAEPFIHSLFRRDYLMFLALLTLLRLVK